MTVSEAGVVLLFGVAAAANAAIWLLERMI